eukprot:CAMPEP_0117576574 /NCGR_PEP_ID=MMETSP0784-20121206/62884_1 /TAXON_ID=39447 /ORGANISM="" /LENGTH=317 /DNA_ID=CAMNT_0005375863 /DNA_START=101 /DNA_END=1051 /DNA_ORIENTATION=-
MAALPSAMTFTESEYGSTMNVFVRLNSFEVFGTYRTPPPAGMLGGYVHGFGRCDFVGSISRTADGITKIVADWKHTAGPLQSGTFEVEWSTDSMAMKGWWKSADDGSQKDWIWKPNTTTKSFVATFVHSIWMSRYTLLCCWVFLLQTGIQAILAIAPPPGMESIYANLVFNLVYTVTYVSFLVAYWFMYHKPAVAYMAGVALYTAGYMIFALYFSVLIGRDADSTSPDPTPSLYLAGSLAFLSGSISLVAATLPVGGAKFSPIAADASLFWGSTSFLLGSIAFTVDGARVVGGDAYTPELAIVGYIIFEIGRAYFVW